MISKKVLSYLDKNKIKYEKLLHKTVYTAYDLAKTLKEELKKVAKTLLVKVDGRYVLVVMPAHYRLDLTKAKKAFKAKKIELVPEKVMLKVLKIKPGKMTAFGKLHKLETWVDKSLTKTEKAIISAGSFTESLRLKVKDFVKLEEARLAQLAEVVKLVAKTKKKKKLA
ncbi:MAG: YbaK/EbsC family protein [Candidatus Buchananbacteria bacterium]